jgi:hypothetical protein
MPDGEHTGRDVLEAVGTSLFKAVLRKWGPETIFAVGAVAAVRLMWLVATLDREILATAGFLCVCLIALGVVLALMRRDAKKRRAPELQALIDSLNNIIQGTAGPGAAELQLRAGIDGIARAQASALASQRGMNPALASREIVDRNAALMVEANRGAAELRAKEVKEARQQLADILAKEKRG